MIKSAYKLLIFTPAAALAISCSSSNNNTAPSSQQVIGGAVTTAKTALSSALPSPQGALSTTDFIGLRAPHVGYAVAMEGLMLPGGCARHESGDPVNAPRDYLLRSIDPDYACDEDGNVVNGAENPEEFAPTVFARFNEEIFALSVVSSIVNMNNNVIIPGTYPGEVDMGFGPLPLTAVATNFDGGEIFDTKLAVTITCAESGCPEFGEESMLPSGWVRPRDTSVVLAKANLFLKLSDNKIHLKMYEDCRIEGEGCMDGGRLGWSDFRYDLTTNALSYEYASVQSGGSTGELQRIYRPANSLVTTLAHKYSVDGGDFTVLVHGAQGASSTELSVSMLLETTKDGGFEYDATVCVNAETFAETAAEACDGAPTPFNAGTSSTDSGLTWANSGALFNAVIGADEAAITNTFSDVLDFWSSVNP
jgi:hypothetical protein